MGNESQNNLLELLTILFRSDNAKHIKQFHIDTGGNSNKILEKVWNIVPQSAKEIGIHKTPLREPTKEEICKREIWSLHITFNSDSWQYMFKTYSSIIPLLKVHEFQNPYVYLCDQKNDSVVFGKFLNETNKANETVWFLPEDFIITEFHAEEIIRFIRSTDKLRGINLSETKVNASIKNRIESECNKKGIIFIVPVKKSLNKPFN